MYQHTPARTIRATRVDPALLCADIGSDVVHALLASLDRATPYGVREEAPLLAWQLLRTDIRYEAEQGDQFIRMPWRTVEDGVADCKSQTVLVCWVSYCAGCRVAVRFARNPGELHWGHVYAVIDGVPVDPLLDFGEECASIAVETVEINPLAHAQAPAH